MFRTHKAGRMMSVALIALAALVQLPAVAAERHHLEIEQQDAVAAIHDFGMQTGIQVVADSAPLRGKQFNAVHGEQTTENALRLMLAGTGLTHRYVGARSVALMAQASASSTQAEPGAGADARATDPSPAEAQGRGEDEKEARTRTTFELEEVVVTGTHIRGVAPVGSKVLVISREEIEASGHGRIQDYLETLPQNFSGLGEDFNQNFANNLNLGSEIQLRGLGFGTTLTLINGHRQAAGGIRGAFVDISSIPTAAVERIEVLADGASAIYGSDAIGGVVNIVLRTDYDGAETKAYFGTLDGAGNQTQVSQLFGTRWSGGSALLSYVYSNKEEVLYKDTQYLSSNGDLREFGGSDFSTPSNNPGTIVNASNQPLFAIPRNQDGSNLSASDLTPGRNVYDRTSTTALLPDQELHSVFASATHAPAEWMTLKGDLRFGTRDFRLAGGGQVAFVSVPSTNPFYVNPTGGTAPVRVAYNFEKDLGTRAQVGRTSTYSGVLGADIALPGRWKTSVSGSYARETNDWQQINGTLSSLYNPYLASSDPNVALNVFGDGSFTNPATLAAIRNRNDNGRGVTSLWSASAIADGALFTVSGGQARLALGVDYLKERLSTSGTQNPVTENARSVSAGFGEFVLPLIGESNEWAGLELLQLSAAGRYDSYSDSGNTFNPKFGVTASPGGGVYVRGTWGTSFRAPPFFRSRDGFSPATNDIATLPDPRSTTGPTSRVLRLIGNSPGLEPETAKVWTVGLDVQPSFIPGLDFGATYFDIDYRDKIGSASPTTTVLQLESIWAPVITRNPTQAQIDEVCNDPRFMQGLDCTGPFAAIIDARTRNLAVVKVRGMDVDVHYSVDTAYGTFGAGVNGTYMLDYEQGLSRTAPLVNVLDTVGNPLSLRLRGNVSWSHNGWSTHALINYSGGYDNIAATPVAPVGSWTTVDLALSYAFPETSGWIEGTRLSVSGVNVFDRRPPFVNVFLGHDAANSNQTGRLIAIQLTKAW